MNKKTKSLLDSLDKVVDQHRNEALAELNAATDALCTAKTAKEMKAAEARLKAAFAKIDKSQEEGRNVHEARMAALQNDWNQIEVNHQKRMKKIDDWYKAEMAKLPKVKPLPPLEPLEPLGDIEIDIPLRRSLSRN